MELTDGALAWLRSLEREIHHLDDVGLDGLVASGVALGLMAHRTPAWTEPYVALLDQLIERCTRTGPGAPDGVVDLASASALLVLVGIRSAISGAGVRRPPSPSAPRWVEPLVHAELAEVVRAALADAPGAPHHAGGVRSEVLAAAGLGLRLHDVRAGTALHAEVFHPRWERARAGDGLGAGSGALRTALLAAPQAPVDARSLFDAAWVPAPAGEHGPNDAGAPRVRDAAIASLLLREWALHDRRAEGAVVLDAVTGWEDLHPAEEVRALLAAADSTSAGSWSQLVSTPIDCPQIVGVDVRAVVLRRAEWVGDSLVLRLEPLEPDRGRSTTFRLVGAEPRMWYQSGIDGATTDVTAQSMVVRVPLVAGDLEFTPGSY